MYKYTINTRIRQLREERGWSVEELAERSLKFYKQDRLTVKRLILAEADERDSKSSYGLLNSLAKIFGVHVQETYESIREDEYGKRWRMLNGRAIPI